LGGVKTIGIAVVSFVAGLFGSGNAGDFRPLEMEPAPIFPLSGDLPSLMAMAPLFQAQPFTLDAHPTPLALNFWWPDFGYYSPAENKVALRLEYHARPQPIWRLQEQSKEPDVVSNFHPLALEVNPPAPHEVIFDSMESSWSPPGMNPLFYSESAVTRYLNSGAHSSGNNVSRAKAKVPPAPIVRAIDVQYAGASERSEKAVLAQMRSRVGRRYSERVVEDDIRELSQIGEIARVRIFGAPMAHGVKLFVVLERGSDVFMAGPAEFNFNIGYQF